MAKRKKTSRTAQNVERLDRLMARMVLSLRSGKDAILNTTETALVLKILAYALKKMAKELKEQPEEEE